MPSKSKPPALIGGPYKLPRNAHIGVVHECEVRGELIVTGFTDAPIPWIKGRPREGLGPPSLVVRGDLARAIRAESVAAVAWWWGVSRYTVSDWRRALGVGRKTEGTAALLSANPPPAPTSDEARERGSKGGRKRWGDHKAKEKEARKRRGGAKE